jgi:hypothetical protein
MEDTTSHRGKSQGIEDDRPLGRKLTGETVRGGEGGLSNGTKQRAHLNRAPIDLTPLPKLTN